MNDRSTNKLTQSRQDPKSMVTQQNQQIRQAEAVSGNNEQNRSNGLKALTRLKGGKGEKK